MATAPQLRKLRITLIDQSSEAAEAYEAGEGYYEAGETIEAWTNFRVAESFLDPLGNFSLSIAPPPDFFDSYREKFSKGRAVQVHVGNNLQATGVITTQTITINREGATIALQVKSLLAAAYEASMSPIFGISSKSDIPVSQLIMTVLSPFFSNRNLDLTNNTGADLLVKSGQSAGNPLFNLPAPVPISSLKAKQLKAQRGETPYGFVSRTISRLGFILKTDAFGGLLLDRPIYDQEASYTICDGVKSMPSEADLILDGMVVTDTNDGQFSEVVVSGQALMRKPAVGPGSGATNPLPKGKEKPPPAPVRSSKPIGGVRVEGALDVYSKDYQNTKRWFRIPAGRKRMLFPYKSVAYKTLDRKRFHYNSELQPYKPKFAEDKMSRDVARCRTFAELMMGLRSQGGYTISCSVSGFEAATGTMWTPNTVVRVKIDKLGIDENMWILSRTFSANRGSGQVTTMVLMPLYSLVLGDIPS